MGRFPWVLSVRMLGGEMTRMPRGLLLTPACAVGCRAVNKLLDSAQPSVEFTRRKYVEAHDAIVASAAYTQALEAAAHILHKV